MKKFFVLVLMLSLNFSLIKARAAQKPPPETTAEEVEDEDDDVESSVVPQTSPITPQKSAPETEAMDTRPNEPPYTNTDEMDLKPEYAESPVVPVEPTERVERRSSLREAAVQNEGKKIAHPNASKGLYLIDRTTGKYYYKTDVLTKKESTMSIRLGSVQPPTITTQVDANRSVGFSDIYTEGDPTFLLYDYEWLPFESMKQVGVQLGTGLMIAQGTGKLLTDPLQTPLKEAREQYTFIAVPLNLGLVYRFEFARRQWLAPYVAGGGTYFLLAETRDDGRESKFLGTPAGYGAGGVLFNLSAFDEQTAFIFDREYGIRNLWLAAEFRIFQSFSEELDMSSNLINVGVTVDY